MKSLTSLALTVAVVGTALTGALSADAQEFKHEFGELRQYHKHWLRVCPQSKVSFCRAVTYTRTGGNGFFLEGRFSVEQTASGFSFRFLDQSATPSARDKRTFAYTFEFSTGERVTALFKRNNVVSERVSEDQNAINALLPMMKAANWVRISNVDTPDQIQTYSLLGLTSALSAMPPKPVLKANAPSASAPKPEFKPRWHRADGWPGEYPTGFTVAQTHSVKLRTSPSLNAPKTVTCAFKEGATYHVWNKARVASDSLKFISFTQTSLWRTTKAVDVYPRDGDGSATVKLPAQALWTSVQFLSEGYHILQHDGVSYLGDHSLFQDSVKIAGPKRPTTQIWLGRKCAQGTTGWMVYEDWANDNRYGQPNIAKYGNASDL